MAGARRGAGGGYPLIAGRRQAWVLLALAALTIPVTAWSDADDGVPVKLPNHVHITTANNRVTVTLDPVAAKAAGIRSEPVRARTRVGATVVEGTVVDTAPLLPLLQVHSTFCRGSLPFAGRWGKDLLFSIGDQPAWRTRLLQGTAALVEVRLPSPNKPPPASIQGRTGAGRLVSLRFAAPAADGRHGYFFARGRFKAWTPVRVALPAQAVHGASLPAAAVVWWGERAWVYVDRGGHRYQRRPVVLGTLKRGRWFATQGITPGERVVTQGAEMLLSAEQGGGMSLGDDDD